MPTHVGTYDAITLQPRERWTPRGGIIREPRVKLLNTSVAAYVADLRTAGYSYEVEPLGESPHSIVTTLSVEDGATSTTVLNDTWELDGNDLEKSIWELPKVVEQMERTADLSDRATIRQNIESFVRGESSDGATAPAGFDSEVYEALVASLLNGVEAFSVSTYVLRRTLTLTANTEVAPGFANANKIFSRAQLLSAEPTIPDNLQSSLPEGVWLKKTPTASQQSDGRWVYRVEYWWAEEYDEFLYETAT